MQMLKYLLNILSAFLLIMLPGTLSGQECSAQPVKVDIYRLERQDSSMVLDISVDLSQVRIIPDCTVYLVPVLRCGSDSLELAPLMLNGPQSDRMYRRRRALGYNAERVNAEPYLILREGEHPLPCVSYRACFSYADWMGKAEIGLRSVPCDCDFRLQPLRVEIARIPPVEVIVRDTLIIRDTLYLAKEDAPVWKEAAEYKGYCADIYFPNNSFTILPDHYLNRKAWSRFTAEVDSLLTRSGNTLLGIIVTGYSSPEGDYQKNDGLARQRTMALKDYLERKFRNLYVEFHTGRIAESWDDLTERIAASDMPEKEAVLSIIRDTYGFDEREAKLKNLSGGKPWAYMVENFFPLLRRASCRIDYLKTEK